MYRDMKSNVDIAQTIAPQVQTAGVVNGSDVDLRGYDAAMAELNIGAIVTSGVVGYKLQESDVGAGAGYADVLAADLQGAFVALAQNTVQRVGYAGAKRFIRAVATYASGTSVAHGCTIARECSSVRPLA